MHAHEQDRSRIQDDTVDALVSAVRDLLADAAAREDSANTRATGLAGFAGLIASVATAGGQSALEGDTPTYVAIAAAICFGTAMASLFAAVGFAVVGVLLPQSGSAIGFETITKYPSREYVYRRKRMVQGELLNGLITTLGKDRHRIDSKFKALRWAYVLVMLGVGALAVFGCILAIDAV